VVLAGPQLSLDRVKAGAIDRVLHFIASYISDYSYFNTKVLNLRLIYAYLYLLIIYPHYFVSVHLDS
jgi:hypothetical protein